jgi:hypothetical protein
MIFNLLLQDRQSSYPFQVCLYSASDIIFNQELTETQLSLLLHALVSFAVLDCSGAFHLTLSMVCKDRRSMSPLNKRESGKPSLYHIELCSIKQQILPRTSLRFRILASRSRLEYVVLTEAEVLAEDDPERLLLQHELARAYFGDAQSRRVSES